MEVKGTAVIATRDYVKKKFATDYTGWLESLSPESKKIFTGAIDSTQWYPIESSAIEPTEKISKLFFNNDFKKGAKESGRYSAESALTGIYKIFVKAANPTYIIKRASRVFATYYRPCEIQVVRQLEKGVVVELSKVSIRYETIENRIVGWCEKALEISGCEEVSISNKYVRDDEDGKVIEIEMRWN